MVVVSAVGIAFGIGLRLWVSLGPLGRLNADEVVSALMARDLLAGHWSTFFWAQSYGGTIELVPFAGLITLVGDRAAIVALPLIEWIGIAIVSFALARRRLDRDLSLAVVALIAVAPAAAVWFSTRPMLFYNPTMLFGLGALLLADQLRDEHRTRTDRLIRLALLGLLLGLGWWTSTQILYFAVPAVYALVRHRLVRTIEDGVALAAAAVVGALPWLIDNLGNRGRSLTDGPPRDGGIVDHLVAQIERGWPMIVGTRRPFDERWLLPGPSWLLIGLVAAALAAIAAAFVRVPSLRSPLAGVLPAFAVLQLLAPTGSFVGNGRYYTFLVPPLAYAIVAALSRVRHAHVAIAALVAVGAVTTTATLSSMRDVQFGPEDPDDLIEALDDRGIDHLYTNYWVGYPLAWADDELVVSPNFADRRPDWSAEVRAAPRVAYVFWLPQLDDAQRAADLIPRIDEIGIDEQFDVGGYRVVVPATNVAPEQLP